MCGLHEGGFFNIKGVSAEKSKIETFLFPNLCYNRKTFPVG